MSDVAAEVAALRTEVKYLKIIIPAGCGLVALLILVFWGIERHNVGARVHTALNQEGIDVAISKTKQAREQAEADSKHVGDNKKKVEEWIKSLSNISPICDVKMSFSSENNSGCQSNLGDSWYDVGYFKFINSSDGNIEFCDADEKCTSSNEPAALVCAKRCFLSQQGAAPD